MKPDAIIERLFGLVEKLVDRPPAYDQATQSRLAEVERRLDEMDAVWPMIVGENHESR